MKFIPLHTRNTAIVYKNSLCSSATVIVLVFVVLSVMLPVLLVSLLSPYSGIAESRVLYEQPRLQFKFQHLFVAEMEVAAAQEDRGGKGLVACSTFGTFNSKLQAYGKHCEGAKYWTEDLDDDGTIDRAHFQLQLEGVLGRMRSFELALFFQTQLKHKCQLSPPALLAHHLIIPSSAQMNSGTILLKADLELKQHVEFTCPFPGRNTKTHFRHIVLHTNGSSSPAAVDDISQFQIMSLLQQLKANPAYFQMTVQETYFRQEHVAREGGLRIQLDLDVMQVPARYHLSVWERLGQFWLYFASFFGISFYVMNKLKDFLFGHHIIRSWEIIPWKKLY